MDDAAPVDSKDLFQLKGSHTSEFLEQVHQSVLHTFYLSEPSYVLLREQAVETLLLLDSLCVQQLRLGISGGQQVQ